MAYPYTDIPEIYADIDTKFPDNITREITPLDVREVLHYIVEFFGRKTAFYDNIVHTGDANYTVLTSSFILILDDISDIRTINLLPSPVRGSRLLMFVTPHMTDLEYWQTNTPFYDGNGMRTQLGNGRQELIWDDVANLGAGQWSLIGGL